MKPSGSARENANESGFLVGGCLCVHVCHALSILGQVSLRSKESEGFIPSLSLCLVGTTIAYSKSNTTTYCGIYAYNPLPIDIGLGLVKL